MDFDLPPVEEIIRMRKDRLLESARQIGLEVDESESKAEIMKKILKIHGLAPAFDGVTPEHLNDFEVSMDLIEKRINMLEKRITVLDKRVSMLNVSVGELGILKEGQATIMQELEHIVSLVSHRLTREG